MTETDRAERSRRWMTPLLAFAAVNLMMLLNLLREVGNDLAEGNPIRFSRTFLMEATGMYSWLLLLPLMVLLMRRFPITSRTALRRVPAHIAASMAFGATHTLIMLGSRTALFVLLGWGAYDYGVMTYRFPMEFSYQFLLYWIVYLVVLFVERNRRLQRERLRAAALEQQLTRTRLESLQSRLQPHFLFNTLNMISSTVYEDPSRADRMIADLSRILRFSIDAGGRGEHALDEELEILRLYLEIMKSRFGGRVSFASEVAADAGGALVPVFLLQPLVENSLKHGMRDTAKGIGIRLTARRDGERLSLALEDDGPGLAPDEGDPGSAGSPGASATGGRGLGLANTAERLDTLFGAGHEFGLENLPRGGLRVSIVIPFRPAA